MTSHPPRAGDEKQVYIGEWPYDDDDDNYDYDHEDY